MCQQALQLRRAFCCMPANASRVLARAAADQDPPSVFGPGTAICVLFGRNGWCLHPGGLAKGPGLSTSSPAIIKRAIEQAWSQSVQDACTHRTGLLRLCKAVLRSRPTWKQATVARHMTVRGMDASFCSYRARAAGFPWPPHLHPSAHACHSVARRVRAHQATSVLR